MHISFLNCKSIQKERSLKTYLDWVVLSKMDFSLISGSGYGITASMMSFSKHLILDSQRRD